MTATEHTSHLEVQTLAYFTDGTYIGVSTYVGNTDYATEMKFTLTDLLEEEIGLYKFRDGVDKEGKEYLLGLVDRLQEELAAISKRLESL